MFLLCILSSLGQDRAQARQKREKCRNDIQRLSYADVTTPPRDASPRPCLPAGLPMQGEIAGPMADHGFKSNFNLEKIVTTSNFELFSYSCVLAALAISTSLMPGQFVNQTLSGVAR